MKKTAAKTAAAKKSADTRQDEVRKYNTNLSYSGGVTKDDIKNAFIYHMTRNLSKSLSRASELDRYHALALALRDLMAERWIRSKDVYEKKNPKIACYVSFEYLIGRTLGNAMLNLEVQEQVDQAMKELGYNIDEIREVENDAGLGNGGLGRLAACFLDSMATLSLPAYGYGIRYDYGIFQQKIEDGYQVEEPDNWLRQGNPWEICRNEKAVTVRFYGHTEPCKDSSRKYCRQWVDTRDVLAMPYDTPIPGYRTGNVNTLRLWSARSLYGFKLDKFHMGDYINANIEESLTENITKVLYPNDNNYEGMELRLKQQYFLVSATVQDIIGRHKTMNPDIRSLADKLALQLNDTHPSIAVPELMRILIDEEGLEWDEAWAMCTKICSYTNHTLMSEALEKWPVSLMEKLLPRILEIIYEINCRFLRKIANKYPGDTDRL